jgi:uncharacterized protein (TIGR02284 family)
MENIEATIETLNDLVQINNDRIEGYQRAIKNVGEENVDLKHLFTDLIGESHHFKLELGTEIQALGKDVNNTSTTSGKLHRTWLDIKALFNGHNAESVLEECEFREDAIKKTYKIALEEKHLPDFIKDILRKQQQVLLAAHDEIKSLRNEVKHEF